MTWFQLITLETTLRLYWRDPRLQVDHLLSQDGNNSVRSPNSDYILLNPAISNFIWFPDIYIGEMNWLKICRVSNKYISLLLTDFAKELRMPTVIIQPASLRIYRNSTVRYATQWVHSTLCVSSDKKVCHCNWQTGLTVDVILMCVVGKKTGLLIHME